MNQPICIRCGGEVPPSNDALIIEQIRAGLTGTISIWQIVMPPDQSVHLLPVGKCLGSPSRAQYIEGQPRDTRPGGSYHPEIEQFWREAYRIAQERYGTPS